MENFSGRSEATNGVHWIVDYLKLPIVSWVRSYTLAQEEGEDQWYCRGVEALILLNWHRWLVCYSLKEMQERKYKYAVSNLRSHALRINSEVILNMQFLTARSACYRGTTIWELFHIFLILVFYTWSEYDTEWNNFEKRSKIDRTLHTPLMGRVWVIIFSNILWQALQKIRSFYLT